MPQFQPPVNIPFPKSKFGALRETLGPAVANFPLLIAEFKQRADARRQQAFVNDLMRQREGREAEQFRTSQESARREEERRFGTGFTPSVTAGVSGAQSGDPPVNFEQALSNDPTGLLQAIGTEGVKALSSAFQRVREKPLQQFALVRTDTEGRVVEQIPLAPGQKPVVTKPQSTGESKAVSKQKERFINYTSDANQMFLALNKIDNFAGKLGDFGRGIFAQSVARTKAGIKEFGKNEDISLYRGAVNQELIPIARKLTEEKGPINEADVDRVEKGLGTITSPLEDKKNLINEFRIKLIAQVLSKLQNAQADLSELGEISPQVETQLQNALRSLNPSQVQRLIKDTGLSVDYVESVRGDGPVNQVPQVGQSFNGQRVRSVRRVR